MIGRVKLSVIAIAFIILIVPNYGYGKNIIYQNNYFYAGKLRLIWKGVKAAWKGIVAIAPSVIAILVSSDKAHPSERNYYINLTSNTESNIKITGIKIKDTYITIDFLYINNKYDQEDIWIYPPDDEKSIFIYSENLEKRFKWISIDGDIPVFPKKLRMKKWQGLEFKIKFKKIDDNMNTFHIIEGDMKDTSQEHRWNFYNINLAARE